MQTLDTIEDLENLPVKIEYVGCGAKKDWGGDGRDHTVDQWRVTITSKAGFYTCDYFTGLGLRKPAAPNRTPRPSKPKVADVMRSLLLDASAADENFNDWCANYGYSDDSIRALNTYKACLETAAALRRHLGSEVMDKARELLQDY